MKKRVSLLLLLILCVSTTLIVTSCNEEHPIAEFKDRLESAGNYQISVTKNDSLVGITTSTMKIDGNIWLVPISTYSSVERQTPEGETYIEYVASEEDVYIEYIGNDYYMYVQNEEGVWSKTQNDTMKEILEMTKDLIVGQFLDHDNFEKVEGKDRTYQKRKNTSFDIENISFDNIDVVVVIEKDSCTIEMIYDTGDVATIVISEIGNVKLTLPSA